MVIFFIIMGTLQSGLKHTDTLFAMLIVFTVALSHSVSAITVFVEWSILNVVSLLQAIAGTIEVLTLEFIVAFRVIATDIIIYYKV